jgi:hypothetical protein
VRYFRTKAVFSFLNVLIAGKSPAIPKSHEKSAQRGSGEQNPTDRQQAKVRVRLDYEERHGSKCPRNPPK